jgi:uncharacterized protein (UPF0297 family)
VARHLKVLEVTPNRDYKAFNRILSLVLHTDTAYILDPASARAGKPRYAKISRVEDVFALIAYKLKPSEIDELQTEVGKKLDKYMVTFETPSFPCPRCGRKAKMPVQIEQLFFRSIWEL